MKMAFLLVKIYFFSFRGVEISPLPKLNFLDSPPPSPKTLRTRINPINYFSHVVSFPAPEGDSKVEGPADAVLFSQGMFHFSYNLPIALNY